MSLTAAERDRLIEQYATGPARLKAALAAVPAEALDWRPDPEEFSVHEIICHCADSETNAHGRIRYLLTEDEPVIVGYDPMTWAATFHYADHPMEASLATVVAVRANTVPILRRLRDAAWETAGMHTESGRYTATDWLRTYAAHLEEHVHQIGKTVAAWKAR
jgi:hypothetical protein